MPSNQSPVKGADIPLPSTFAALRHRNYRLWFIGQTLSLMGTWMQSVAQGWLVFQLTGSELALGTVTFLSSVPTLFFMLPAGVLIDRFPKRKLLLVTQSFMLLLAFALTALTALKIVQVWHIGVLAFCLGIVNSFDAPCRQAMAVDMVDDRRDMMNAIALNSTIFNLARIVGPALGGFILALLGPAWCFGLNGLSFVAVLLALLAMRFPPFKPVLKTESTFSQVKAGVQYMRNQRTILIMVSLVGVSQLFGFAYSVLLPAYAADVLHVGQTGLGSLNAATGVGALIASLIVASLAHSREKGWLLTVGSFLFPIAVIFLAASRGIAFSMFCLALTGGGFVTQNATINTLIQSMVPDELRGRVLSVYMLVVFGATPFASLFAGGVGQALGVRAGVAIGAGITLIYTSIVFLLVPALRHVKTEG